MGLRQLPAAVAFLPGFSHNLQKRSRYPFLSQACCKIPLVRLMHGASAKIGVLTASSTALTEDHFKNASASIEDYEIKGMEGYSEFWETIIEGKRNDFDMVKLEEEICHSAKELTTKGNLDALILECTDLSAFSRQIQDATGVPVYDINSLVEYVNYSVCRKDYI